MTASTGERGKPCCSTCGSDDPTLDRIPTPSGSFILEIHESDGCPDPFHSPEVEPQEQEGERVGAWQRCPVCVGHKIVPTGFYDYTAGQSFGTTSTAPIPCRQCSGTGMVLAPEVVPASALAKAKAALAQAREERAEVAQSAERLYARIGELEERERGLREAVEESVKRFQAAAETEYGDDYETEVAAAVTRLRSALQASSPSPTGEGE